MGIHMLEMLNVGNPQNQQSSDPLAVLSDLLSTAMSQRKKRAEDTDSDSDQDSGQMNQLFSGRITDGICKSTMGSDGQ